MLKKFALLAALSLVSCDSPETTLLHLQHDFWDKFARHDFFEIKLKNEVLHLPLPPSGQGVEQQKLLALKLRKEAYSIDKERLSAENQRQLTQLQTALNDCVQREDIAFFDPSKCVVTEQLRLLAAHPDLPLFLEKIPDYYAQIEQRWQTPDARFVSKAVAESQNALDMLAEVENKSGGELFRQVKAARAAVKDFIGLCQSALLQ